MPLTLNETTQMGSVYLFTCARKDKVATLIFLLVTALLYWSFHLVILYLGYILTLIPKGNTVTLFMHLTFG